MLKLSTRRGLNVVLVARDKNALEKLALEVKAEGVDAKVVVEDFAKEGAVARVVDKVTVFLNSTHSPVQLSRLQIVSSVFL